MATRTIKITSNPAVIGTDISQSKSFEIVSNAQGPAGIGFPGGGTTGQIIKKQSATDNDVAWVDDTSIQSGDNISELVNDSGFITSAPVDSVAGKTGVVTLDSSDVGLSNVDNTSDLDKPVSTATQTEIDTKADASHTHTLSDITDFDANDYATGAEGDLASSAVQPGDNVSDLTNDSGFLTSNAVDSVAGKTGVVTLDKTDIGLDDVDNTSDLDKPISTATQTALDGKASSAQGALADSALQSGDNISELVNDAGYITTAGNVTSVNTQTGAVVLDADDISDTSTTNKFTTSGDISKLAGIESGAEVNTVDSVAGKTGVVSLVKADVGLGNVDNTADSDKPISTATQTEIDTKEDSFSKNTAFNKNFGSTTGTVCEGDDSRLSDARTPISHTHTLSDITDFDANDYATGAEGDLASSAVQPGDNISDLVNDAGYITSAGASALDDLTDVTITSLTDDELIISSGGNFINQTFSEAGLSEVGHTHTLSEITDFDANDYATGAEGDLASSALQNIESESIGDLSDMALVSASLGDMFVYNGNANVWNILAKGSEGQVLTVNDSATYDISWEDPSAGVWGSISGTLSDQTDLQSALDSITIGNLDDVVITSPATNNVLRYISGEWKNIAINSIAATNAQGALADSAIQPGDNISELVNDAGYITSAGSTAMADITDTNITSPASNHVLRYVSGEWRNIAIATIAATNAQGALADSAVQPGDNISELVNDAGYLTSFTELNDLSSNVTWVNVPDVNVTQSSVTQHEAALSITESQISDFGTYLTNIESESIGDLSDITITSLTDNELLFSSGGSFINRTLAEAGISAVGHTHTLSDITDFDAADYATGAEGDLASSAVQPGDNISDLTNDSGFITSAPVDSVAGKTGVVSLVKADVGLGNVDNTADLDKPISTATQTEIDTKQDTITGGASTIVSSDLTANRVLLSNGSGKVAISSVTNTTLGYLDATSSIQTQINGKAASSHTHTLSDITDFDAADYATGAEGDLASSALQNIESESIGDLSNVDLTGLASGKMLEYNGSNFVLIDTPSGGSAPVDSVNGSTGVVVLDPDDLDDTSTTNKFTTAGDISKLAGIESGAEVNDVDSVAGKTGIVTLVKADITDFTESDYATGAEGDLASSALQDVSDDTTPTLGGDLDAAGYEISNAEIKDYSATNTTPTISSGAITFDYSASNCFNVSLTENITTITLSNPPASGLFGEMFIELKQDATGSRTVTWPAAVKWAGGTAPTITTAANSIDVVTLTTRDGGTTWLGNFAQDYS